MNASRGHVRAGIRAREGSTSGIKDEVLLPLVQGTIAGDERAWQELCLVLDPRIERIAGRTRVTGRLAGSWDDRRDIVVEVLEHLRAHGFERVRRLHEVLLRGDGSGWPWISAV